MNSRPAAGGMATSFASGKASVQVVRHDDVQVSVKNNVKAAVEAGKPPPPFGSLLKMKTSGSGMCGRRATGKQSTYPPSRTPN